jgi:hypothetical protein
MAKITSAAIDQLSFRAASGDVDAVERLYEVATQATNHLVNLAKRKPEFFRSFIGDCPVFPMLVCPKDEPNIVNKRHNARRKLLDRLGIASNLGKTFSNKSRWSLENVPTQYAAAMHYTVEINRALLLVQARPEERAAFDEYRKSWPELFIEAEEIPPWVLECQKLPDFTKETWKEWFAVGWRALMHKMDGHPERDTKLRTLGSHREGHHVTANKGSKTSDADVRDGIKKRLQQAMQALVP